MPPVKTPPIDMSKDKLTINLPRAWSEQLRQLASRQQEQLNDVVLSSLKVYLFLAEERRRGSSIYVGKPGDAVQRELVFIDLPGPDDPATPDTSDLRFDGLAANLDELLTGMNTPEARAARQRAFDATGEQLGINARERAASGRRQKTAG
jgi:hypothetical protein